jgi:hypothetical protein
VFLKLLKVAAYACGIGSTLEHFKEVIGLTDEVESDDKGDDHFCLGSDLE